MAVVLLSAFLGFPDPLAVAISAAGASGVITIDCNAAMISSQSPTCMLRDGGGIITLGNYDLTGFNAIIDAGPRQIFSITGSGRVKGTFLFSGAWAEWFGAIADDATDSGPAFNYLYAYFLQSSRPNGYIYAQGNYFTSQSLLAGSPGTLSCPRLRGMGGATDAGGALRAQARLRTSMGTASAILLVQGLSGIVVNLVCAEDIMFWGTDTNGPEIGIENRGLCGIQHIRCSFENVSCGSRAANTLPGQATERFVGVDSVFGPSAATWKHYYIGPSGNQDSFRGSGLRNTYGSDLQNSTRSTPLVLIDADHGLQASVYDAPMDFSATVYSTTALIKNLGDSGSTFIGDIRCEISVPVQAVDQAHKSVFLLGRAFDDGAGQLQTNYLYQVDRIHLGPTSQNYSEYLRSVTFALALAGTIVITLQPGETYEVVLSILATGYDWTGTIRVARDSVSPTLGFIDILTSHLANNAAGYGAPVLSYSAGLKVALSGYTGGAGIYMDAKMIGSATANHFN